MRPFAANATGLFLLAFLVTMFGFKFNLIDVGGSGLRLDDVVVLCTVPLLILAIADVRITREFRLFAGFVLVSLLSLLLGVKGGRISLGEGAFYWLRNLQYMCFYFLGVALVKHVSLDRIFRCYLWYVVVVLLLQYLSIIPTLSLFEGSRRAVGNTGGPYELAVLASAIALFFWFQQRRPLYALLGVIILLLTESRVTLVGLLLIVFFKSFGMRGRIVFALVGAALVAALAAGNVGVLSRFMLLLDPTTLDTFASLTKGIPVFTDTWNYRAWAFVDYSDLLTDTEGDRSTFIRYIRQTSLLMSVSQCQAECVLFGLGPSFASSAVDGNLVRLYVEYGVVGTFLFLAGLWRIARSTRNATVIFYLCLLLFTALAIDILVSSKAMSLFWFLCGYYKLSETPAVHGTAEEPGPALPHGKPAS
jgi:hypothetical protein